MASASSITGTSTSDNSNATTVKNPKSNLTSADFVNLLVTQLQNQDPTQPMTNAEMLQQVTQIGTLQSQETLSTSLDTMTLQNQISSASSMIGKSVTGTDADGNAITGTVASIKVVDKNVTLHLTSGSDLSLSNVTGVANATTTSTNGLLSTAAPGLNLFGTATPAA